MASLTSSSLQTTIKPSSLSLATRLTAAVPNGHQEEVEVVVFVVAVVVDVADAVVEADGALEGREKDQAEFDTPRERPLV